jgi:uncharacterized integral membrane protein
MSTTWLKIKVWTKLTVAALLLLYLLLFILNNSNKPVEFWFFPAHTWTTSLLYFSFFTFLAGLLTAVLTRTSLKTLSQMRDLKKRTAQERKDRELKELQSKASLLQSRPDLATGSSAPPTPPADTPRDVTT